MDIKRVVRELRVERRLLDRAIDSLERLEARRGRVPDKKVEQALRQATASQPVSGDGKVVQFPLRACRRSG